MSLQESTRVRLLYRRQLLGRPLGDQLTALVAAFGSQVDDPIGDLDDLQVVLDDQHAVACIHQAVQDLDQLVHIGSMQPDRWFVQHVQGAAGGAAGQLLRQLDALGFAAGQRGAGLPDLDVAQTHFLQKLELVLHVREGGEFLQRLVDGHVEDVGDAVTLELDLQGLAVEARAVAHVAWDVDVGQELHLDAQLALSLAGFAAPAVHVEREASGLVAAHLAFGQLGKQFADLFEQAGIGGRDWSAACVRSGDWSMLMILSRCSMPSMRVVLTRQGVCTVELGSQRVVQHVASSARIYPNRDTPVIQTNLPSGMLTVMFFRLLARAPTMVRILPLPSRRFFGTGMCLRPDRYAPVKDSWGGR